MHYGHKATSWAGVTIKEVTRLPQTTVDADPSVGKQVLKLLEALDEHDDVQTVSTNLNITDELMAE